MGDKTFGRKKEILLFDKGLLEVKLIEALKSVYLISVAPLLFTKGIKKLD